MPNFSSDFFEACLYFVEKERGITLSEDQEKMVILILGNDINLPEIKEHIILAIEDDSAPSNLKGEAFFVLGKMFDFQLKDFFIRHLKREVEKKSKEVDYDVLYQIMIALDNLEESIFNRENVASVREKYENLSAANAYLDSIENKNYIP